MKRVFLIVLDSVGIGEMPDAKAYNDEGSNTLKAASTSKYFDMPNMKNLGLFNIDTIDYYEKAKNPEGSFARVAESSKGKDTTTGHWEIAGIISDKAMPVYPKGFPKSIISEFELLTGRKVICNKPYSGTEVIKDYGDEHINTGSLIVYTSADSVFQIAAHEDVVPLNKLYEYCEIARNILTGENAVGRVIARPFIGKSGNYTRTANRHDFSLKPNKLTMLDELKENQLDVIAVGKIYDIFAGKGITEAIRTTGNEDGIKNLISLTQKEFNGICFVNLVDFDMIYGHRNDIDGYAKALTYFDTKLPEILKRLQSEDILIITADHGCDPSTSSTDHSREYIPLIVYGATIKSGINLGTLDTFADIGATIIDYFDINQKIEGNSFLNKIKKA